MDNYYHKWLFALLSICLAVTSSCRNHPPTSAPKGTKVFEPQNLYPIERLPVYFNRVVVLPSYIESPSHNLSDFIDDIFVKELSGKGIFEVIKMSPETCLKLFGRERLSSSGNLREDFLSIIERETGANGVLFIDVHSFNPYRPISIGVRGKLVDVKAGDFAWAIDETFDSGNIAVLAGAQVFQNEHIFHALSKKTKGRVSQSPRAFCQYVAHSVFSTLPGR